MQLTIIGGAGVRSPIFVHSLIYGSWPVKFDRLVLHDNDPQRLDIIGELNRMQVQNSPSSMEIVVTDDVTEAVSGADYIFAAVRVGQESGRVLDETVARSHGLLGQETTGPGGFAMALRTVPELVRLGHIIEQVAPTAWVLNFSNPVGITTQALRDHTGCNVIGICDSPHSMHLRLAQFLGLPAETLESDYIGLNHLGWITGLRSPRGDHLPEVVARYAELAKTHVGFALFEPALIETLGVIPNDYLFYYYYRREAEARMALSEETRGQLIERINRELLDALAPEVKAHRLEPALDVYVHSMNIRHATYLQWERTGAVNNMDPERDRGASGMNKMGGYEALAMSVIGAMEADTDATLALDVVNGGTWSDFSTGDVVEVSCEVAHEGPRPKIIKDLPESARQLMSTMKSYERLTVQAAMTGDKRTAQQALLINPLVGTYPEASAVVRDYIDAHRTLLPRFQ